jgi:hypothetical protein
MVYTQTLLEVVELVCYIPFCYNLLHTKEKDGQKVLFKLGKIDDKGEIFEQQRIDCRNKNSR